MDTFHSNDILLTARDAEALALMLADPVHATRAGNDIDAMIDLLSLAQVVDGEPVPDNVVALDSHVTYKDAPDGDLRSVVLCFPINANPLDGRISVLSPVGRALLGRRIGQKVVVELPSGAIRMLQICEVRVAAKLCEAMAL